MAFILEMDWKAATPAEGMAAEKWKPWGEGGSTQSPYSGCARRQTRVADGTRAKNLKPGWHVSIIRCQLKAVSWGATTALTAAWGTGELGRKTLKAVRTEWNIPEVMQG